MLDILGDIYIKEKEYSNAMKCYQQMINTYKNEEFHNYIEGEGSWYGISGATGIIGELNILTHYQPDYNKAKLIAYELLNEYKGQGPRLWESTMNYEDIASNYITECLEGINATLDQWEKEYREILNRVNNKELSISFNIESRKEICRNWE